MIEAEDEWKNLLDEATRRANVEGRGDVADYLRLRQANDEARAAGISLLLKMFVTEIERATNGVGTDVERDRAHRFPIGAATMVGERVVFRRGVRALTIEAGFPRAPQDGFIAGGGLARARISHFGDARAGVSLVLARDTGALRWFRLDVDTDARHTGSLAETDVRTHITRFLS